MAIRLSCPECDQSYRVDVGPIAVRRRSVVGIGNSIGSTFLIKT